MARINPSAWAITAQRNWIRDHGQTLAGYVAHYGTLTSQPVYTLAEVKAIYEADRAYLAKLEAGLA